eukprot:gene9013-16656_t
MEKLQFLNKTYGAPNTTEAITQYTDVEILPPALHWLLNSLMTFITILGLIGNGLVCYFFAKRNIRMTPFNMLLLNLSLSDLLADIFAYPHIFVDLKALRKYPEATRDFLCALTIGVTPFAIVTYVSVLTLMYISVTRYVYIKYPLKAQWFKSKPKTAGFIVLAWLFSIAFIFPNTLAFNYDPKYAICERIWPKDGNGYVWTAAGFLLGFLLPMVTMILSLVATIRHFRNRAVIKSSKDARRRGAIILLGSLILAFFVFWGPCFIYLILSFTVQSIWPEGVEGDYTRMRYIRVFFLIALINSVADPFIYGYRNPEFNKCFRTFFAKICFRLCNNYTVRRQDSAREMSSTSF